MTEEELEARAAEERKDIVERYKYGRGEGAKIDPWEEATFEVYHKLDRYGFIHEGDDWCEESNPQTQRLEKERDAEREKKWLKMLRNFESVGRDKLRSRIFKGVPNAVRGKVWSKLLSLDQLKEQHQGKYKEMLDLALQWSPDIRQIDLDVNRTYREHIMFRERYNSKQRELFNVLGAYSVYNTEVGYCQGMSQIVALLLMYLDEEDAFWAFSTLITGSRFCMHGFYIPGFPKLVRYQEHHEKIMEKYLPKLKKHFERQSVDVGMYALKWYFQCFLDRIPFRLTLRVWDVFFLEGERVLTCMAYNILKMHRKNLQRMGMDDLIQVLQVRLQHDFGFSDDVVIERLHRCMDELRKNKLDYVGPPLPKEMPTKPLGIYKPDIPFDKKVGRRTEFTSVEKLTCDQTILRHEESAINAQSDDTSNRHSDLSGAASFDEDSSMLDGSHKSLAGTSITSTADLSIFSSTRSQAPDSQSADTAGVEVEVEVEEGEEEESSSGVATPLASDKGDDVVRIFVPYSPVHTTTANGNLSYKDNRIRITIVEHSSSEDMQTPIIEQNPLMVESNAE